MSKRSSRPKQSGPECFTDDRGCRWVVVIVRDDLERLIEAVGLTPFGALQLEAWTEERLLRVAYLARRPVGSVPAPENWASEPFEAFAAGLSESARLIAAGLAGQQLGAAFRAFSRKLKG